MKEREKMLYIVTCFVSRNVYTQVECYYVFLDASSLYAIEDIKALNKLLWDGGIGIVIRKKKKNKEISFILKLHSRFSGFMF